MPDKIMYDKHMGTWGTRIYEDDVALDVRGDFMAQYHGDEPVEVIERALRAEYWDDEDPDTNDVALLALACAELETGSLTDATKQAAYEVIASERSYKRWQHEAEPAEVGRRKRELNRIKQYLDTYDGTPVKRKSWLELQKADQEGDETLDDKLDDVDWHMQAEQPGVSDDEYFRRCATTVACYIYWATTRDYLDDTYAADRVVKKYRAGKLSVFALLDQVFDQKVFRTMMRRGTARKFTAAYYDGRYLEDLEETVGRGRDPYSYVVTDEELERMAARIDQRYEEYQQHPDRFAPSTTAAPVEPTWGPKAFGGVAMLSGIVAVVVGGVIAFGWFAVQFVRWVMSLFGS